MDYMDGRCTDMTHPLFYEDGGCGGSLKISADFSGNSHTLIWEDKGEGEDKAHYFYDLSYAEVVEIKDALLFYLEMLNKELK